MSFETTEKIIIMGRSGCGKSFLAKRLQQIWPRRVIIDPLCEYTTSSGESEFPGGIVVNNFREFGEKLINLENTAKFILIFQFHQETLNYGEEFDEICRILYYFGNIQIVMEEVQLHASTHQMPHWLKNLLLTGRHQNISLLFTSQRPGEINKTIISQCAHIFCGQILEGNDLRYVSNFLNQDISRITNLPNRKFLWRSPAGVREINNDF